MLLLFVWFLLFKFPPARRGKQSLTVKQIGTFFFFVDLIIWSRRSNTNCSRDNGGSSDWICFLFHCVSFFSIRGSDRVITLCPMAPHMRGIIMSCRYFGSQKAERRDLQVSSLKGKESVTTSLFDQDVSCRTEKRTEIGPRLRNTRPSLVELKVHICTFYFNKLIANFR